MSRPRPTREVWRPDTQPACTRCPHVHYEVVGDGACPSCDCTHRATR